MDIEKADSKNCELLIEAFYEHVFTDSYDRIKKCLDFLSEDEVWYSPNEHVNSIGNLILHLCGNAKQYILSGIGGNIDSRKRQAEFDAVKTTNKAGLKQQLDELKIAIAPVLSEIDAEKLKEVRRVQGYEKTVLAILIHVIEHFSYHTGQITFLVKFIKNIDTGYYAGVDLNITE
ncbi:MAG: hypothetical protein CMO01_08690 [Thalassobius sp.]|nr:hypothetical protein [Thalassovita sp.]